MNSKQKEGKNRQNKQEVNNNYRGILHEYADTALLASEKEAGRVHAAEKHEKHLKMETTRTVKENI